MRRILLLLVLLAFIGRASAADWMIGSDGDSWIENTTFDNTTVKYDNAELLNGYNPSQSLWVTTGGMVSGSLQSEDAKHIQRFTAPLNKTVTHIGLYLKTPYNYDWFPCPKYKVGLQLDNGSGYPDGNWVNNTGYGIMDIDTSENYVGWNAWSFIPLNSTVDIIKNMIYHIVVEWDSEQINSTHFHNIYIITPSKDSIPLNIIGSDRNIGIIDSNLSMLTYTNAEGWVEKERGIMVFLLDFDDDTYYGQPWCHAYQGIADKSLFYVRENVKIDLQNKTVEKVSSAIGVRLDWMEGSYEEKWAKLKDVHYEIYEGSTLLRNGTLCTKAQIRDQHENKTYWAWDKRFAWYETNLSTPLTLEKNKTYITYLFSLGTTNESYVYTIDAPMTRPYIYTAKYPYDGPFPFNITTWDGTESYFERWSINSGSIWKDDNKKRDLSLKFKLVDVYGGNLTSITKDAELIGSSGDVWKQIKFEGSLPSGTSVDIGVNSSSCGGFVTVQDNAVSGTTYNLPVCAQGQYANWRLTLQTNNTSATPEIENVVFGAGEKAVSSDITGKGGIRWSGNVTFDDTAMGDGDIDVLAAASLANDIAWYENNGSENFTKHVIDNDFDGAYGTYATDVDGDGDIDVLGAAYVANTIIWYDNNGSEGFDIHYIADLNFDGAISVYATDVDGDGDIDVLGAARDADEIAWWANNGSENFTKHVIDNDFNGSRFVYATDVDGDGDIDVLGAAHYANDIAWYENNGSENFTKHVIDNDFLEAYCVYATDVDGDGDIDVLGAAYEADDIAWYENNGSENFTKHVIDGTLDGAISVYATDVDKDGDIDVLGAAYYSDIIAWYENNGSESFTKHVIDNNIGGANSIYTADVDDDGDIDLISVASKDDDVIWYENNGSESFTKHVIDDNLDGVKFGYDIDIGSETVLLLQMLSGYPSIGNLTSITKDAESIGSVDDVWKQIKFEGIIRSDTNVSISVNSSTCGGFVTVQDNAVSGTTYNLPVCAQERYANWKLTLQTNTSSATPGIENVTFISGAGWVPSSQGIYWNPLDPIWITRNATTNIFSRIPTQSDNNATLSFKMVVTTT